MSKLKYKVGDKVRIKGIGWYNENKDERDDIECSNNIWFYRDMSKFCGKVMTISHVGVDYYTMVEDLVGYWTDEMIEGLVEEKCPQDFIEKYCKSCGTQRCDRTKEYLDGCPHYNAYRCKKQNNVMEEETKPKDMGEVSDGYHTFNELYEYRMLYNAALFNEFAKQGLYDVHKSRKHSDGKYPFGDSNWFIVMAELPTGQISNHYEMKDWDKFQIPEKPLANKWDEHSPRDVAERLTSFTNPKKEYPKTYEECAEIIAELTGSDCNPKGCMGYMSVQLTALQKLLICRDAYWKIAGEEMGLGKPWEPDWHDNEKKHTIACYDREIIRSFSLYEIRTFSFPTPEMRDVFKENFGPDIEFCKEFL